MGLLKLEKPQTYGKKILLSRSRNKKEKKPRKPPPIFENLYTKPTKTKDIFDISDLSDSFLQSIKVSTLVKVALLAILVSVFLIYLPEQIRRT